MRNLLAVMVAGSMLAAHGAAVAQEDATPATTQPAPAPTDAQSAESPETATSPTPAPEASPEVAAAGKASEPAIELEPIEVRGQETQGYTIKSIRSATRTETALVNVPQSITVVTREQIRDQSMQGIGDVMMYVPGVGMQQGEGNRETPIFRGNQSTADFFADGLRDDAQYYRDLYNIERVEVLKGPNAMIFGRGGAGGVINRVTRQADWTAPRELVTQLGSHDNLRTTLDVGDALGNAAAVRVTGLFEDTESYRDGVILKRSAVNPTMAFKSGDSTLLRFGAEYLRDERTADRGQPSMAGKPYEVDSAVFFGDAERSTVNADVSSFNTTVEHDFGGGVKLRNAARYADYDKFYQNIFAGTAVAFDAGDARDELSLSAYNNDTQRQNVFNQTDLTVEFGTGGLKHTLLTGLEIGRQDTKNRRLTGTFPDGPDGDTDRDTALVVPASDPTANGVEVIFAPAAAGTDADNDGTATIYAGYVQDQVEIIPQLQAIAGVRFDHFEVDFNDRRPTTAGQLSSSDDLVSPRAGLIYKPVEPMSVYVSYSKTYLPRAGEQLASLTTTTGALDPEEFVNYEIGTKYELDNGFMLTGAVYQLERSNVAIADPSNPGQFLLVEGQQTDGVEVGFTGNLTPKWVLAGGYAYQDAVLTATASATALAGAAVAQVPYHSASLWNRYDFTPSWAAGVGVQSRSESYATTSNAVELDGYVRVDGAMFYRVNDQFRAQLNVENLLDEEYHPNAHTDNNITPGSPVAVRLAVTATF